MRICQRCPQLRSLTYHTVCVSFIRFFKSAIFVSRFLSSSLRLARSFCSLLISSMAVSEFGAYSTIRALECLSLTSSGDTFSSSPARYRSFSTVPPYIDTGNQLCFVSGYLHGTTTTHDPSRILFAVDRRMIYDGQMVEIPRIQEIKMRGQNVNPRLKVIACQLITKVNTPSCSFLGPAYARHQPNSYGWSELSRKARMFHVQPRTCRPTTIY